MDQMQRSYKNMRMQEDKKEKENMKHHNTYITHRVTEKKCIFK